jgi:hypothetical protein
MVLPARPGQVLTIPCAACGFTVPSVAKAGSFVYTCPDCGCRVRVNASPRSNPSGGGQRLDSPSLIRATSWEPPPTSPPGNILLSREREASSRQKRLALVRQLVEEAGDQFVLQPLDKDYALEFLTQDDLDVVYRVVGRIGMFTPANSEARA